MSPEEAAEMVEPMAWAMMGAVEHVNCGDMKIKHFYTMARAAISATLPFQKEVGSIAKWAGNRVQAVAEIPGWVFVMPVPPSPAGRPFSIAAPIWAELPKEEG